LVDLNGDGFLDIVGGTQQPYSSTAVSWATAPAVLYGDGAGGFKKSTIFLAGTFDARSIAFFDVNRDGFLDFLVGNHNGPNEVLLGDGAQGFTSLATFPGSGDVSMSTAVGDVNGDGYPDVLSGNYNGANELLLGGRVLGFMKSSSYPGGGAKTKSIIVGDVNGDGFLDVLSHSYVFYDVSHELLLGDGAGGFTPGSFPTGYTFSYASAFGDFNNDGFLDVFDLGREHGKCNRLMLGDGAGNFVAKDVPQSLAEGTPYTLAVGDVNSDGFLDVVIGSIPYYGSQIVGSIPNYLLFGDGAGGFVRSNTFPDSPASTRAIALGDVNNDGYLDVISGHTEVANQLLLGTDGAGNFARSYNFPRGSRSVTSIALGDVNYDGFLDVLWGNDCSANELLLGSINGFVASTTFPGGSAPTFSIALGDVNGDGFLDVLVGNKNIDNGVGQPNELLLGDGAGSFTALATFPAGSGLTESIALGDVNNDGHLDVLVGNYQEPNELILNVMCPTNNQGRSGRGDACVVCPTPSTHNPDGMPDVCEECDEHTQLDFTSACSVCAPGMARPFGAARCAKCPMGTAQVQGEGNKCEKCPAGTYTNINGSVTCFDCSMGSHAPLPGATSCIPCPIGSFSENTGSSSCTPCPVGGFCASAGAQAARMTFEACAAGTYGPSTGASSNVSCISCPAGKASPVPLSSSADVCRECLAGSVAPHNGTAICTLCPAGTYQGGRGKTACEACTPGRYCGEGSPAPLPCPGGTYGNGTGLTAASDCEPVLLGYWAPTGSPLPEVCFPGFYCPGAANDDVSTPGGSKPIIVAVGANTQTETVETVEQEMTLDMTCDDFNLTAVTLTIAAQYGVDWRLITIPDPCAGSSRRMRALQSSGLTLSITIASTATVADGTVISSAVSAADLVTAVAAVDVSTLSSALSAALGANITVTAEAPKQETKQVIVEQDCPRGKFCSAGETFDCPADTYQPYLNVINGKGCLDCMANAITNGTAKVSKADCFCDAAKLYIEVVSADGNRTCVCPEGHQQNEKSPPTCVPCPFGTYKDTEGNMLCQQCPQDTTTIAVGATNKSLECVCVAGLYDANTRVAHSSCTACPDHTQCNESNTLLETLPLSAGYWRQSSTAEDIRPCFTSAACLGGSNVAQQCAPSQTGPYCAVCNTGYFGGGDGKLCEPCTGIAVLTFLPVIVMGAVVMALLVYFTCLCICGKSVSNRVKGLGENTRRKRDVQAKLQAKSESAAIKVRILIALVQMLSGIGITFAIQYPPIYQAALAWLSSIISLDLPKAMPLGCIMETGFFTSLILRTALPLLVIVLLVSFAQLLQRCFRRSDLAALCSSASFFVLFLVYPSCSSAVFQALICDPLEEGGIAMLRVDYSITCWEGEHVSIMMYAFLMAVVYPLGTPLYFLALLYVNRAALETIRCVELKASVSEAESLVAAKAGRAEASERSTSDAASLSEEAAKLRRSLPPAVQKLTAGYTMRCYWFEIFECVRKLCLVGLPVILQPSGSAAQLMCGLIVCFLSMSMLSTYAPYIDPSDNFLAKVAQVSLFFSLVSSIALKLERTTSEGALGVLLIVTTAVPPVVALVFESGCDAWKVLHLSAVAKSLIACFDATLGRCLTACLGSRAGGGTEPTATALAEAEDTTTDAPPLAVVLQDSSIDEVPAPSLPPPTAPPKLQASPPVAVDPKMAAESKHMELSDRLKGLFFPSEGAGSPPAAAKAEGGPFPVGTRVLFVRKFGDPTSAFVTEYDEDADKYKIVIGEKGGPQVTAGPHQLSLENLDA